MEQRTILVVEDAVSWQKLHKRILQAAGFTVHIAANCADGIDRARVLRPDCIVLDYHLPDGNAVSVCSVINTDASTMGIPVILFSSDPEAEEVSRAQCGASLFMLKGWEALRALPGVIEGLLTAKKIRRPLI